jgi:hypothetical protein
MGKIELNCWPKNMECCMPAYGRKKLAIMPAYGGQGCRARLLGKAAGQGCMAMVHAMV